MSTNISRKLKETKIEKGKHIRCKRVRNVYSSILQNSQERSTPQEQQNEEISNNCRQKALSSNKCGSHNAQNSDWELTGLLSCIKEQTDGQSPAGLLARQNLGVSRVYTGDASRKLSNYAIFSDKKSYTVANDAPCDTKRKNSLAKQGNCQRNENNCYISENDNKYELCQALMTNSCIKDTKSNLSFRAGPETKRLRDSSNSAKSPCRKFSRKACGSISFHPTSEYQRLLKREVHPKLLSEKLGVLSLRSVSNNKNVSSSGSSVTQKSHSALSITHCSPVITLDQTRALNIFNADGTPMCESTQNVVSQPVIKFFYCADSKYANKTDTEENNNYIHSTSSHQLNVCIKNTPSSTLQRSHEHINTQTNSNEFKRNNSRVRQIQEKLTQETRQNTDIKEWNASFDHKLNNHSHTRETLKQEKPYRQWHRVSRVVTSDSRFIISSSVSSRLVSNQENKVMISDPKDMLLTSDIKNTLLFSENTDHSATENYRSLHVETGSSFIKELDTVSSTTSGDITETINGSQGTLISVVCQAAENALGNMETENKIETLEKPETSVKVSATDTTFCTMSLSDRAMCSKRLSGKHPHKIFDKCRNSNNIVTDGRCHHPETRITAAADETRTSETKDGKDYNYGAVRRLMSVSCNPRLQRKLSFKLYQRRKRNDHKHKDAACGADDHSVECDYINCKSIDNIKPASSISGVSQVSGPPIANSKMSINSFDYSKMTPVSLKSSIQNTANENRHVGHSHGRILDRKKIISVCDSASAHCNEHTEIWAPKANNFRHVSRSSSGIRVRLEKDHDRFYTCQQPGSLSEKKAGKISKNGAGCLKSYSKSECGTSVDNQTQSTISSVKPIEVLTADAMNRMLQGVSREGLHVHWSEPTKQHNEVQDVAGHKEITPERMTFRKRQKVIPHSLNSRSPCDKSCV